VASEHRPGERHGEVCYLQLPASDLAASTVFYGRVFGWKIEEAYPSFTAPGLIGQFVDDRLAVAGSGPLLWITVDRMDEALTATADNGGAVVDLPYDDGPERLLATVHDPAGNLLGLVEHRIHDRTAARAT
jgi:uncharacterized protein